MRNGNVILGSMALCLWKGSYRTYEEWKLVSSCVRISSYVSVLTVPMRNGNRMIRIHYLMVNLVLTVPMRNGNEFRHLFFRLLDYCSYRTYEEWKHLQTHSITSFCTRSYRTYEEWKLGCRYYNKSIAEWFLPYLWGMETWLGESGRCRCVLFLPYLWGMETSGWYAQQYMEFEFLPYLWGMETWLCRQIV